MLGPGIAFGQIRKEDRYYAPAKGRGRNCCQQWRVRCVAEGSKDVEKSRGLEEKEAECGQAVKSCEGVEKCKPKVAALCNLERFMEAVTLSVPAYSLCKTTNEAPQPYFELFDLWDSFRVWSAYGAGVPLLMNGCDAVVQYYVPFLSAIQLYGASRSCVSSSRQSEDSDVDAFRDTTSDSSSECGFQKATFNIKLQNHSLMKNEMENLSLMYKRCELQGDSSSDECEFSDSQGQLLFEYFERRNPYTREPLADKISDLARVFPHLRSLKSCDLLSSSWLSVAWYPIYRIPTGPTLRDLDACFLTFHSLHTATTGASNPPLNLAAPAKFPAELSTGLPKIILPSFGLSTYKFKGASWVPYGGSEHPLVRSLEQSVQSWLKLHNVSHPDYLHFCRR